MTSSQASWLQDYAARWIVPVIEDSRITSVAAQPCLDFATIFARSAPLIAEIGCGHGEAITTSARLHPQTNFLGFEVFDASIASTLGKIAANELTNVRLIAADAIGGLAHLVPDQALSEVWIFFPDPWPKKRHHKRRLVSPAFADLLAQKLTPGGLIRLATDWESYATAAEAAFADHRFELVAQTRFTDRPITKFEARAIAAGRTIYDLTYRVDCNHENTP
jgi:tRNA (guanine-N7-)-methyltransferase